MASPLQLGCAGLQHAAPKYGLVAQSGQFKCVWALQGHAAARFLVLQWWPMR